MTRFAGALGPLAVAERSGLEESIHLGVGVALGPDGAAKAIVGAPDLVVYPRSCLKPLQAHAMVVAGLALDDRQLALACASHDGSPAHLAVVREILDRYGLAESDLDNTPSRPTDLRARRAARRAGTPPSSLQQNCSGKHAAMLATCVVNGWPTADYRQPDHPVQALITAGIGELGCTIDHIGVDGCGAPTHAFAVVELARAFARLAVADAAVTRAMRAHPVLVAGPTRDVTRWMQAIPGLTAKDGADGVFAAALPDGRAVAFKVADGSNDARRAVGAAGLRAAGIDVDRLAPDVVAETSVAVFGHGEPVGHVRALEWSRCSS